MPELAGQVRQALQDAADPQRAPAMQAYMKSQMPFLGVAKSALPGVLRPVFRSHPLDRDQWLAVSLELWDRARYREERYAALALLRRHSRWLTASDEQLLRHLVTSGAWWDLVDEIATKLVGPLRADLDLRAWALDQDMWIRRAAIISQVGHRGRETDPELLAAVIEPNTPDRRFWIAKAIGWALRDYAYTDPQWVRDFVAGHDLAPLSVREATKHL